MNNKKNQIFINKNSTYKNYLKFALGKSGIDGRIKIEKDSILLDIYIKPEAMRECYQRLETMSGSISNKIGISSEEWLYSKNVWIEKVADHGEIKLKRFNLDLNNEKTWEKSIEELIPWIEKIEKVFREWLPKC